MNWFQQIFRRNRLYSDLSEEIQEHLEEKIEELVAGGMSREEAVAAARREFGNALLLEERGREVWRWPAIDNILSEAKYALRQLFRSPGFSLSVIIILALAIGANTGVFTVLDALLLRPLPYSEPDRLGAVLTHINIGNESADSSVQDGETWELVRDQAPSLQTAVYKANSNGVNLQASSTVRYVREQRVSSGYFDVLGIPPLLGRMFTKEEDRPQGPKVVVLSYALWKSTFAQDREILGSAIHLKGEPYTVVGVMPEGLTTTANADLWTPLRPERSGEGKGTNYHVLVRLNPGKSWAQADAELGRLRPQYFAYRTGAPNVHMWLYALPLQKQLAYEGRDTVLILMSAVGLVLLIACANLAGLFLVRVLQRGREIATRMALGASRAAILRQLLMEPLILAIFGGGVGLLLASACMDSLPQFLSSDITFLGGLHLDKRIIAFTIAATVCASLLIALLPAMELRRIELYSSIRGSGNQMGQRQKRRTMQGLIAAEVALTVVLLAGAGLLIRTLVYLQTMPPGFDSRNVLTAQASLNDARYHDAQRFQKLLRESVADMERIPGVESAAVGLSLPYEKSLNSGFMPADGAEQGKWNITDEIYVSPAYFSVLRIPVLEGRAFSPADSEESRPVCIVNRHFAKLFLAGNALGRHLKTENSTYEVVGVVTDVVKPSGISDGGPLTTEPIMYVPATQVVQEALNIYHVWFEPSWIVRSRGPVDGLASAMQKALAEVDPALPFAGFHDLRDFRNGALDRQRLEVTLLSALAGLALLLSIIGIYGLVSNLVTQRTREIGIRMALGSTLERAMIEIGKSGIVAAVSGMIAGLALTIFAIRWLRSELYGVRPYDPGTFAAIVVVLLAAVLVASFAPTSRIARIDPASSLRAE